MVTTRCKAFHRENYFCLLLDWNSQLRHVTVSAMTRFCAPADRPYVYRKMIFLVTPTLLCARLCPPTRRFCFFWLTYCERPKLDDAMPIRQLPSLLWAECSPL